MSDLPLTFADTALTSRLAASLDVEGKIPRALEALGPVADRDLVLVDGDGGIRAGQLADLGARVTTLGGTDPGRLESLEPGSVDVVVALWSTFRAGDTTWLAAADAALRPAGRLLVVHDYGRDDVSRLMGERAEYGAWSRHDGWFHEHGFRIRVIHCFWTFASLDEAAEFVSAAFGARGDEIAATLRRPRLSYNVAVYHRSRGGPGAPTG